MWAKEISYGNPTVCGCGSNNAGNKIAAAEAASAENKIAAVRAA